MDMDNDPLRPLSNMNQPKAPQWLVLVFTFLFFVGADCIAIWIMR